ncbi:MAG: hypothetical protein HY287_17495 [Planctomycetes bacterium]|nr:hypothetical protein [Planctomycetota bacterium]MBI3836121.1 hypothetical protein [Planctomycetota bacterium]
MELSKAGRTIDKFVRRKVVIDPTIQWNCALTIALIVFLCSSLLGFGVFGQLHQQARMRLMAPDESTGSVTFLLVSFAVGSAAVTAGGVGFWSLWMTRRLCGPAFVMERYLNELKTGRIPQTRSLRKNDEFQQLFMALNEAFDSLRSRANTNLAVISEILESIRMNAAVDGAAARENLAAVTPKLEMLRAELTASLEGNESNATMTSTYDEIMPHAVSRDAA